MDAYTGTMIRVLKVCVLALLLGCLFISMFWGTLAIWFRLQIPEIAKLSVITLFLIPGVFAAVHLCTRKTRRAFFVYTAFFMVLLSWWASITPPDDGNWSPEVARQVTGEFDGDLLTLTNVRAFEWRTPEDFTERWITKTYDLSKLTAVDMFLSYWGDPNIAHFMLSFSFSEGEPLAWSVQVRREKGTEFSPVADFFKNNTLVILASEERDIVGVRSNVRGEDVHLFRLKSLPETREALIRKYVEDANLLSQRPAWYNSLTTNCTTVVLKMIEAVGDRIPFDWRLIVNGYLPEYAYDKGILTSDFSIDELRALGLVTERAMTAGLDETYSGAIRVGVPAPQ